LHLFRASAEMLAQKLFHGTIKIETILFVAESVPFVFFYDIFNFDTTFFESFDNNIGLFFLYPRIIGALSN
jgi:hypothetical protein